MTIKDQKMAQIELLKNRLEHHETLTNAVIALEHVLLRGAFVLNGGAMIAMLALYGARTSAAIDVYWPLVVWTIGLGLCAAAAVLAALSQWQFQIVAGLSSQQLASQFSGSDRTTDFNANNRAGQVLRLFAGVFWLGSVMAFVVGSFIAAGQLSPP